MERITMKFGGGILNSAEAFLRVLEILKEFSGSHVLVVVSAVGQTTNKLEKLLTLPPDSADAETLLQEIYQDYLHILDELGLGQNIVKGTISNLVQYAGKMNKDLSTHSSQEYRYDQVVSIGEKMTAQLLLALLKFSLKQAMHVPAENWLHTDASFKKAEPKKEILSIDAFRRAFPSTTDGRIAVTEGFIGVCAEPPFLGSVTTLGREGSDYSAVIAGALLRSERIILFKDVEGIYDKDPKQYSGAIKFDSISPKQLIELTSGGAQVLSPRVVDAILEYNLSNVEVRNFHDITKGTVITLN